MSPVTDKDTITVGALAVRFLVEAADSNGPRFRAGRSTGSSAAASMQSFWRSPHRGVWIRLLPGDRRGPGRLLRWAAGPRRVGEVMRRHGLTPAQPSGA